MDCLYGLVVGGSGGAEWNRMDALALDFHRRVRAGYQALIAAEPARWVVVDAAQPVEALSAQIGDIAAARLRRSEKTLSHND